MLQGWRQRLTVLNQAQGHNFRLVTVVQTVFFSFSFFFLFWRLLFLCHYWIWLEGTYWHNVIPASADLTEWHKTGIHQQKTKRPLAVHIPPRGSYWNESRLNNRRIVLRKIYLIVIFFPPVGSWHYKCSFLLHALLSFFTVIPHTQTMENAEERADKKRIFFSPLTRRDRDQNARIHRAQRMLLRSSSQ